MTDTPDDHTPNGPTYAPDSVSVQLKGFIDERGQHSAIIFTFGMGNGGNVNFIIDPQEWYPIAIESLVQICKHLPEFRPKYWVDGEWLKGHVI